MKLIEISIKNYRSIKYFENGKISQFQALIGENNSGKSNLLSAIDIYLSGGSGGIKQEDFNNPEAPIVIKCKFSLITPQLKKVWKPYLINDELILEKHIWLETDSRSGKPTIKNEFHGYQAEPVDWFLSLNKIKARKGDRPKWKEVAEANGLPDYFIQDGKCTKPIYEKALTKYLSEHDVVYDPPDLSSTQTLGFPSNVISSLPKLYLLKAVTDYSDEIDKRATNTAFRKLMGALSERILKKDPRYQHIETALKTIKDLLNEDSKDGGKKEERLSSLAAIENKLKELLCKLMPSVEKVRLRVLSDDVKSIFARGVELSVDDGTDTDVLLKGHGLQRCIVFSLIQALILNERNQLLADELPAEEASSIILAIEEPELYIHPQLGKVFYDVLDAFAKNDQVIYSTHSPRFIDVYEYENIAIIQKTKDDGTKIFNCDTSAFDGIGDRKIFKGLTQLNSDINELFFAKNVIVVEGPEDKVAITETLKKQRKISNRPEEIEITIIVAGGKPAIPFFIRVLNAFSIKYAVLHDLDITDDMVKDDKDTHVKINANITKIAGENRTISFPVKLETTVGVEKGHFKDQYEAMVFFNKHDNINTALETIITDLINKLTVSVT